MRSTAAWGSKENHPGRSSRAIALKSDSQNASKIIGNLSLISASSIVLIDKVVKGILNTLNVMLVVFQLSLCCPLEVGCTREVPIMKECGLKLGQRGLSVHVEKQESVRNDSVLLQSQSLRLGPWEAFNDPRYVVLLILLNLLLN